MSAWPNVIAGPDGLGEASLPVDRVDACMYELVEKHGTGLCARMALDHLTAGGKRLRARLALAAARALGVDANAAVPWAAACELLHNASLVHDDLQDGDRVRRDCPALWTVYGADQAINAGDLMLMLPTLAIGGLDTSSEVRWQLSACVARHGARTARGQAEEMSLRALTRLDMDAYLDAAFGKTAGLFGLPVEGAAILAGKSVARAAELARPFEVLGLAYQMIDDVIDVFGDKGRGAPGADIREGKVSALVVAHLARRPQDRLWLAGILRAPREETTDDLVQAVTERFAASGAMDDVLDRVDTLVAELDGPLLEDAEVLRLVGQALRDRVLRPVEALRG